MRSLVIAVVLDFNGKSKLRNYINHNLGAGFIQLVEDPLVAFSSSFHLCRIVVSVKIDRFHYQLDAKYGVFISFSQYE